MAATYFAVTTETCDGVTTPVTVGDGAGAGALVLDAPQPARTDITATTSNAVEQARAQPEVFLR